ncbi:hypothetical protein KEM56_006406 [Ascosphaera pollenicola]|nr:hypothetical protein KEM56_006406 [Ascosphaera pollenicola]
MKLSSVLLELSVAISIARGAPANLAGKAFFDWDSTNFVLAFGDSWTYVQGEHGSQNFSFIGDRFDTDYSPTELYFNKIKKNEVCLDTPLHHSFSIQFDEQISLWSNHTSQYIPVDKNRALVATFIGINDIQDTSKYLLNETGPGFSQLYNKIIGTQYDGLQTLYQSGFKNFLVFGLPPLDKSPPNLKKENPSPNATMIHTWNSIVQEKAKQFEKQNADSNLFYFDLYDYLDGILKNASTYGFKNTTAICDAYGQADVGWNYEKYGCQPIEEYFWYNTGHITYAVHKLLGNELTSFLQGKSNFGRSAARSLLSHYTPSAWFAQHRDPDIEIWGYVSVWSRQSSISPDAASKIRDSVSGTATAGGGFVQYDRVTHSFVVERCNSLLAASRLGPLITDTVEAEEANDLLEVPNITRLEAVSGLDDQDDEPEEEEQGFLLDTSEALADTVTSFAQRFWEPTLSNSVGYFSQIPINVIGEIQRLTHTTLTYDDKNTRIIVSSHSSRDVNDAVRKLSNLEASLFHLVKSPRTTNFMYTSPGKEVSRVIIARLASMGDAAMGLRRVLVERDANLERLLPGAFTTYAPVISSTTEGSKAPKLPKNLRGPPRVPFRNKNGPSSIWAGKTVAEMGNPQDQPDKRAEIEAPPPNQELALPMPGDTHPYLTKEKASIVQRYVENSAEAGAFSSEGIDANSVALARSSTESPKPPAAQPIGRRRQVAPARRAPGPAPSSVAAGNGLVPSTAHNDDNDTPPSTSHSAHDQPPTLEQADATANAVGRRRRVAAPNRAAAPPSTADSGQVQQRKEKEAVPNHAKHKDPFADLVDLVRRPSDPKRSSGNWSMFSVPSNPKSSTVSQALHNSSEANTGVYKNKRLTDSPSLMDALDDPPQYMSGSKQANPSLIPLKPAVNQGIKGKDPQIIEPEKPTFHRTMGQKARNKNNANKPSQKSRSERIAEILGSTTKPVAPSPQQETEMTKFKRNQLEAAKAEMDAKVGEFVDCMLPTLESFESFPGALSFEIQIGSILIEEVPLNMTEALITPKAWNEFFRPRNLLVQPDTTFTNLLTSSGADIDYILSLKDEKSKGEKKLLFERDPCATLEWYEFHCQTKRHETIIINVSAVGDTFVSRPEVKLGSVNIHCPNRIWDAAAVIRGSVEYIRGEDEAIDNAIENFLEKLCIPGGDTVCIYTRMPDGSILHVTKAFAKRQSKHKCSTQTFGLASPANNDFEDDGVQLQITEIQSLIIGEFGQDRDFIRLRAKPYENMVKEQRLWHEVSVVSPIVHSALRSNRLLELGEKNAWSAQELLSPSNEPPSDPPAVLDRPAVGRGIICDMFRVASGLVDRIDSVGLDTDGIGPCILEEQLLGAGQMVPGMSQISASASVNPALQIMAATRSGNTFGAETVRALDSVSVAGGAGGEEDFW